MSWLTLTDIACMTGGQLIGEDAAIEKVERDSRVVQAGDLFLALKGERFDAHEFVPQVAGKASGALVSQYMDAPLSQVVVDDVRLALGRLAAAWRQRFTHPLIGLTGSNGKTTLKEMLTAILSRQGQVLATIGNLNNDIGMPLTLLRLREQDDFAVIEMGANHFGEIDYLTHISRPNVAIINNAGAAHLEGFGTIEGVSRAKGEIFAGLTPHGIAVINADDAYADYWKSLNPNRQIISFGMQHAADVTGELSADNQLIIKANRQTVSVNLKLLGRHNRLNALAATAGALAVGVNLSVVKTGLESLQPVKGRLHPKQGKHAGIVIDDTYNANPSSMAAAVEVLADYQGKRAMIMGDMGELGENSSQLHAAIGEKAAKLGIEQFYTLGSLSQAAAQQFGHQAKAFQNLEDLLATLEQQLEQGTTVLVKGSRASRMERVVDALTLKNLEAA